MFSPVPELCQSGEMWAEWDTSGSAIWTVHNLTALANSALHIRTNIQMEPMTLKGSRSELVSHNFLYSILFREMPFPEFSGHYLCHGSTALIGSPPLRIYILFFCIGVTIRNCQKIQCLPYAGFLLYTIVKHCSSLEKAEHN